MLGRPDEPTQGIYVCAQPDGLGLGPENPKAAINRARAYLISTVGEGCDIRNIDNKPRKFIGYLLPKLDFFDSSDISVVENTLATILMFFTPKNSENKILKNAKKSFGENYAMIYLDLDRLGKG